MTLGNKSQFSLGLGERDVESLFATTHSLHGRDFFGAFSRGVVIASRGRLQFMSEGGKSVMEVEDFSILKGCPWPDFWEGQGNLDANAAISTAKADKTATFRGAAKTAKGTPRHWDVTVSPIFGTNGQPIRSFQYSET